MAHETPSDLVMIASPKPSLFSRRAALRCSRRFPLLSTFAFVQRYAAAMNSSEIDGWIPEAERSQAERCHMIFGGIEAFRRPVLRAHRHHRRRPPASRLPTSSQGEHPDRIFEAGGNDYSDEIAGFLQGQDHRRSLFRSRRHAAALSWRQLQPLGRMVPHPRGA